MFCAAADRCIIANATSITFLQEETTNEATFVNFLLYRNFPAFLFPHDPLFSLLACDKLPEVSGK